MQAPGSMDTSNDAYAWLPTASGGSLALRGDWRGYFPSTVQLPAWLKSGAVLTIDAAQLTHSDADLAPALWALLQPLVPLGMHVELQALPPAVRAALEQAMRTQRQTVSETHGTDTPLVNAQEEADSPALVSAHNWWADMRVTLAFLGETVLAIGRARRRPHVLLWEDVLFYMDQMGPRSVPIVAITTALVGLMLAYMGGAQLDRIGAPHLIADVVTVGMVREMAALMTGVILAGRIGAAIAAQLATMTFSEEIDALRTLGVDPFVNQVLPRLLAMLLVAPLLIGLAMLIGVLAGMPAVVFVYGVPAGDYLSKSLTALNWTHLWIGLFKGTLYCLLVVIAGCREGLHAGRNARAIGVATTRAVVKALIWIVVTACATTVVLQSLGF